MTRLRLKDNKSVSKTKWLTCFLAKTEKILISRLFVVFETVYEFDKLQKNEVSSTSLGLLSPNNGEERSAELLRKRLKSV